MPGRHVLNDLYTEPVPEELSNLKALENRFNQHAKCFQTVVRLGTYKGKVPIYNHVKAVKGTMFFTAKHAGGSWLHFSPDDIMSTLPDPELYIIVDGLPIWEGLADVNNVRCAVEMLQDTNWL